MNISRRVFTTLAALALACSFSGCAGQAIDQPHPGNDAEMLAPFSISFLLPDGNPAADIKVVSGCLAQPTNEIAELHTTDETGTIRFEALVPQTAHFYVFPFEGFDPDSADSFDVDLQGDGGDITLRLSEDFAELYKVSREVCGG